MDRSSAFLRVAKILQEHPVFLYDRRGYGRSILGDQQSPPDFSEHVSDLLSVIDFCSALTGRSPLIVGHSLGGAIALVAATESRGSFSGLLTFESPLLWEQWWPESPALRPRGAEDLISHAAESAQVAESFMRRMIGDSRWEGLPERTRARRREEGRILQRELESGRSLAAPKLEQLDIPVLVAVGSESGSVRLRAAEALVAQIPNARLIPVDGAPHNLHTVDPERFASLIRRLDSVSNTYPTSIP
jgi:pimeloyl-ACP methyl ester carboxylesterase